MTTKIVALVTLASSLAVTACDSLGQAMTAHTDVVARAAGHELSVDKAASLIAANPQLAASPDVAAAVANLWVDYVLLAKAASQDSTLRSVDLEPLLAPVFEQDIVLQLREKVVKFDTAFSDAELKALYDQSGTGVQVRARHILLRLPAEATPAQRDSITNLARQLQQQAAGGADFAQLARQHSADGSAQQGGDLGFFGRGQMIGPFEEAAFALQPGQVSDIVESPYGLHIIKVEERKLADFEQQRDAFRLVAQQQKVSEAEEGYIRGLTDTMNVAVQEGAYAIVRDLATNPENKLGGRAASRNLVTYKKGGFTAKEYQDWLFRITPQNRQVITQREDEELKNLLESLARNEILIQEAARQGISVPKARQDSMKTQAYQQLALAADAAGLRKIEAQQGETKEQAIERRVNALIEATVKGTQDILPLGALSFTLRQQYGGEVFERALQTVVTKVEANRPAQQPGVMPPGVPQPQPPTGTAPSGQ